MRSYTIPAALVAFIVTASSANALYVSNQPVSADYIDTVTNVVSSWNQSTQVLTTTGQVGNPLAFQSLTAFSVNCPSSNVCYDSESFVTGRHLFEVRIIARHNGGQTDSSYHHDESPMMGLEPVSHVRIADDVPYGTNHGTAEVQLWRGDTPGIVYVRSLNITY